MVKWKHIEKVLDHKELREITIKYHSDHTKHRYERVDKPKKEKMDVKSTIKVHMDRTKN